MQIEWWMTTLLTHLQLKVIDHHIRRRSKKKQKKQKRNEKKEVGVDIANLVKK